MKKFFVMLFALSGLTGCAVSDKGPMPDSPPERQAAMAAPWWMQLRDPLIDRLAGALASGNIDLKIAVARIEEARAMRKIAAAVLLPDIALAGGTTRSNLDSGPPRTIAQAGLDATWDLDLFGINRAGLDAADAKSAIADASADDLRRLITADLVRAIIEWRQARHSLAETRNLLAAQQDQVVLFTARAGAGLIDDTLVTRARAQYAQTATLMPLAEAAAKTSQYQIERLLGMTPHALDKMLAEYAPQAVYIPPPEAMAEINIETMRARPDIRAAAFALAAAQADLRAAEASLWPRISVAAFFGVQDIRGSHVPDIRNPVWSLAGAIAAPLLNFGKLRGAVAAADARSKISVLEYEQAVLRALQEAHTALSEYLNGVNAVREQQTALNHRRETVDLARARFERGLVDMTDLTTAQSELDQATLALIERQTVTALAWIRLQRALGS